ncbi:uncharacterized protein J3R85_010088 [Psidium guajava]|nr:uncharacterized protein J3R85_010088 [Psidium guajava]
MARERRERPVPQENRVGRGRRERNGERVAREGEVAVWVLRGEGEVEQGDEVGRGVGGGTGGVEGGDSEGGDRELGAVRALEHVDSRAGDGSQLGRLCPTSFQASKHAF